MIFNGQEEGEGGFNVGGKDENKLKTDVLKYKYIHVIAISQSGFSYS